MTTRLWYPHYVRDFNAKTAHLSLAERGAYRALMDCYWEAQGPLSNDERALCRMIGAFPDEWEQVRENVLAFFTNRDGKLYHKRIDEEIEKAKKQHADKAERLAKARQRKAELQAEALSIEQSIDQSTDLTEGTPTPSPSPTPSPKNGRTEEPLVARKRASRLPSDFPFPDKWRDWALAKGMSGEAAEAQFVKMRNWSQYAKNGACLDWYKRWQNWIVEAPRDTGHEKSTVDDTRQAILRAVVG